MEMSQHRGSEMSFFLPTAPNIEYQGDDTEWDQESEMLLQLELADFEEVENLKRQYSPNAVLVIHWARVITSNSFFNLVLSMFLVYALIGSYIKFICCSKAADLGFDIATIVTLSMFVLEFWVLVLSKTDFVLSFYFWNDIVSIIILIFDLAWIREPIFKNDEGITKNKAFVFYTVIDTLRILRINKLIKILFWKKYNTRFDYLVGQLKMTEKNARRLIDGYFSSKSKRSSSASPLFRRSSTTGSDISTINGNLTRKSSLISFGEDRDKLDSDEPKSKRKRGHQIATGAKFKESRIARRLLYLTNKRLMILLLVMLIFAPIFSSLYWVNPHQSLFSDTLFVKVFDNWSPEVARQSLPQVIDDYYADIKVDFISMTIPGILSYKSSVDSSDIRFEELRIFNGGILFRGAMTPNVQEVASIRFWVRIQAMLYLCQIMLICALLTWVVYMFDLDSRKKLLDSLERMLEKIRRMAQDPTSALTIEALSSKSDLAIIEQTIQKIAFMLVLGFGEAGNSLLSKILWTKSWNMDFLSSASTIYGIFGFCDIRNFTDATETLREEVLKFVNTVADIVHDEVANHRGGANKNIGDAFLVVWKLKNMNVSDIKEFTRPSMFTQEETDQLWAKYEGLLTYSGSDNPEISRQTQFYNNNIYNSNTAELSLISFLKIIARVAVEPQIEAYNRNEKLLRAVPGFKVRLGCGIHAGWAIEGAIGSYFKIDMSYLSPHVDMAAKLEGYTKFYGSGLLFTNCLYNLFTTRKLKELCRKLDRVSSKGADEPYDLYTIDFDVSKLSKYELPPKEEMNEIVARNRIKSYKDIKLKNITQSVIAFEAYNEQYDDDIIGDDKVFNVDDYHPYEEIEQMFEYVAMDPKLVCLLRLDEPAEYQNKRQEFLRLQKNGIDLYLNGSWQAAARVFDIIFQDFGDDVPTRAIYNFMKDSDFLAPENWKNYRED